MAIISIAPLSDLLLNSEIPTKITQLLSKLFNVLSISLTPISLLVFLMFVYFIRYVFTSIQIYIVFLLKYQVIEELVEDTTTNLFNANWQFFISKRSGDFINALQKELLVIGNGLIHISTHVISIITLITLIIIPLMLSIKLISIIFILIILYSYLTLTSPLVKRYGQEILKLLAIIFLV